jgi:hypothetical protein
VILYKRFKIKKKMSDYDYDEQYQYDEPMADAQ